MCGFVFDLWYKLSMNTFLPRFHLFEWEDQTFFPSDIRNALTQYLYMVWTVGRFYRATLPVLSTVIHKTNRKNIYDLCSGGGGAWSHIWKELSQTVPDLSIKLTDYYPNLPAFESLQTQTNGAIEFERQAVDARSANSPSNAIVTMLLAFHHFAPEDAQKILHNAIRQDAPIVIFEIQQRSLFDVLLMLVHFPICWLITPFMKPSLAQLVFTYLIPIIPFCIVWDGMVSVLRTYTERELDHFVDNASQHYNWETGSVHHPLHNISYCVGLPASNQS